MKEIYLLRHAEKDNDGVLTEQGRSASLKLAQMLPHFARVLSSGSKRAQLTAELISGIKPEIDERATFYMASSDKSDAINQLATERSISFLEAVNVFEDDEVISGINNQASLLNELINDLLATTNDGEKILIVSHNISISPAMAQRGVPLSNIDFLSGYVVHEDGLVTPFLASAN